MHGVNVNPMFEPAAPTPAQIKALGFDSVRFILRNFQESKNYYRACKDAGLQVLGIVTNETLETYDVPSEAALRLTIPLIEANESKIRSSVTKAINDHPGLAGIECGNEPDDPGESSWFMEPQTFRKFHNMCGDQAFDRPDRVTICVGGLSTGKPDYFGSIVDELSYDVLLIHPYVKTPLQAQLLIDQYRDLIREPEKKNNVGVSEWFPFDNEEVDFSQMLDQAAPWGNFFFGWSDGMKRGQGLYNDDRQFNPVAKRLIPHLAELAGVPLPDGIA
jgi:hypothetical protein